jgi:hypothetical protein
MRQRLGCPLLILTALLSVSCSTTADMKKGDAAVRRFHEKLNGQLADEIFRAATADYQRAATQETNRKMVEAVHRKMGDAGSFTTTSWRLNFTPAGRMLSLDCETQFANGRAQESFLWRFESDQPKLLGWHINSPLLILN